MEIALGIKVLLSLLTVGLIALSVMIYWIISDKKTVHEEVGKVQNILNAPKMPIKLEFNSDLEYLIFLIDFKTKKSKEFVLKPVTDNTRYIRSDITENEKIRIVTDIMNLMSPEYKLVLMKYIPEKEIPTFIAELVVSAIDNISIELNKTVNAKISR